METLGQYLKRIREEKNLTREDLSKATKYHLSKIEALENDRHDLLPAKAYVRGMLRSISKYLGIELSEALLRHEVLLDEFSPKSQKPSLPENLPLRRLPFYKKKNFHFIGATALFIVLLIVASILLRESKKLKPLEGTLTESQAEKTTSQVDLQAISEAPYKVVLKSNQDIWIKVQLDSENPFETSVKADQTYHINARKVVRFFVSDAQGLSIYANGKEVEHHSTGPQTFILPQNNE